MPRNVRNKGGITDSKLDVTELRSPKQPVYASDTVKDVLALREQRKAEKAQGKKPSGFSR
jgi:hypothetical protein